MKRWKASLARYAADLVMVGGAAAIAVGTGLIYPPAGLIAGGILAIVGAALSSLGGGDSQ